MNRSNPGDTGPRYDGQRLRRIGAALRQAHGVPIEALPDELAEILKRMPAGSGRPN